MDRIVLSLIFLLQGVFGIPQAINCQRDLKKLEPGRRCNLPCRTNSDCTKPARCLCDDWCGKSCYNPGRLCKRLEKPAYGYFIGTQRSFGHNVMYGCQYGYILNGPKTRRCRSDGKWTGVDPVCLAFSTCGQAGNAGESSVPLSILKVVNGQKSPRGAWPWQVMLVQNKRYIVNESLHSLFGGATIINQNWILSTAHHFDPFDSNEPKDWIHRFFLVLGLTDLPAGDEALPDHIQVYHACDVKKHPNYNKITLDHDVSLVHVGKRYISDGGRFVEDDAHTFGKITFTSRVRPVCLPCINDREENKEPMPTGRVLFTKFKENECERPAMPGPNSTVVVTGYGGNFSLPEYYPFPHKGGFLRQGLLEILPRKKCLEGVRRIQRVWSPAQFTDRMLCTGSKDPNHIIDACVGDSGGGLVQKMTVNGHSYWVQVGIVSWGWGCANTDPDGFTYPGYFTDVASVMKWIVGALNTKNQSPKDPKNGSPTSRMPGASSIQILATRLPVGKEKHKIEVKKFSTIAELKKQIEILFGYSRDRLRIFFKRNLLSDHRTLQYYGIKGGHEIYFYVLYP